MFVRFISLDGLVESLSQKGVSECTLSTIVPVWGPRCLCEKLFLFSNPLTFLGGIVCVCVCVGLGQISGCPRSEWQCDDGNCVPDVQRCDGNGDCLDGSDEMDCAGT